MFQQIIPSYSKTQILFNNKRKNYKPILQNKSEIFYQPKSVKRQDIYISPIHNNIFIPRNNNSRNTPLITWVPSGNRNPMSQNYLCKNYYPEKKREVTPDASLLRKRNNDFYFGKFLDKMILLYRNNKLLKRDKSSDCILVKKKKNDNYLSGLRNTKAFRIKESFNIINIIYLIDTTHSMKKYKKLIYSIPIMNKELKGLLSKDKLKIGYILYKDYYSPFNIKENNKHIQIIPPSSKNINIYIQKYIKFEGGNDYSEDWANPILKINELIEGNEKANIVIHFSDANAHGSRFSEYDNKDIEENLLVKALTLCSKMKIKFLGIMLSSFARKSFYECKKIYNNLRGFYDVFEINDIKTIYHDINQRIINIVNNNYNNSYNIQDDENLGINEIDENDFIYKNKEVVMEVVMKPIYEINGYKGQSFTFLPKKKLEGFNKNEGIMQGYIGDCYLISSILSMVGQFPLIFSYIFPNSENYNERTKKMEMIIYKNGNPKVISFNNTYATNKDQLLFAKPLNNELYGIALEKGYAASKSEDGKIQTGYNIIGEGGSGYQVFETLLNDKCETYISNKNLREKYKNSPYKYISAKYLIPKIKKYIDLKGFITVGVFYNIEGGHEYSLQGYKIDKNGNLYIEILNPHRSGDYAEENIYFSKDTSPNKDKLKNGKKAYPIITEDDFKNKECKQSLYDYRQTGYLIMELNTFFKWFSDISFCDPMFGSFVQIIEFIPNSNIMSYSFNLKKDTKFKSYFFFEKDESNIENFDIILRGEDRNIIYSSEYKNFKLIYEKLKKGSYIIEVSKSNPLFELEESLYLKIQCYEQIINDNRKNNIINFGCIYKNIEKEFNFIRSFINKYYKELFLKNKLIEKPNKESIYYNPKNIIDNFYIDYHNNKTYYNIDVTYKYKWRKILLVECHQNQTIVYSEFETFKCSKDLNFYDFKEPILINPVNEEFMNNPPNDNLRNIIQKIVIEIIRQTKRNAIIDILYLIDSTGSMGEEVKNVSNIVIRNSKELINDFPHKDFQFGIIYYNDPIDVISEKNVYFPLTKDLNKIKNFCDNCQIQNGGDESEDWAGGYELALKKIKWRNGKKFILHICDAPAHGIKYSNSAVDNHREEKYDKQLDLMMERCAENNIIIIGFYSSESAKDCFNECKKIYYQKGGKKFIIQEYNKNFVGINSYITSDFM